jgi:hypothetical protein
MAKALAASTANTSIPVTTTSKLVVNYTDAMVAQMKAAAPLDYDKAVTLGALLGRNARSIIAKAKREGIAYIAKEVPTPKRKGPTKKDMVKTIESATGFVLVGLDKAPVKALTLLIQFLVNASKEADAVTEIDTEATSPAAFAPDH